jgi:hypothetical protein
LILARPHRLRAETRSAYYLVKVIVIVRLKTRPPQPELDSGSVMCAQDKPVVTGEPSLADGGLVGSFTRVDPDDAAAALRP